LEDLDEADVPRELVVWDLPTTERADLLVRRTLARLNPYPGAMLLAEFIVPRAPKSCASAIFGGGKGFHQQESCPTRRSRQFPV
jgi:hypothetical protein